MKGAYRVGAIVASVLLAIVVLSDAPWSTPSEQARLFMACACALWLVAAEEMA